MVNMMLAPVHKIGEPCSLVEEIKPASIACLKVGNEGGEGDGRKEKKFVDLKKNWAIQTWSQRRKGK